MPLIDENMAEQATLDWFEELGYERVFGPDIAPDGISHERENYKQVVLTDLLISSHLCMPETNAFNMGRQI